MGNVENYGSIWVIANTKGGVGKSTTSTNLAVGLASKGHSVVIVNADPNEDAAAGKWYESRKEYMTTHDIELVDVVVKSTYGDIYELVRALAAKYDYVIVDTAGLSSTEFGSAAVTAHMIIVPTECDVYDAEKEQKGFSSTSMNRMDLNVRDITVRNRECKAVTFINKAPTRANATQRVETKKYLSSLNYIRLCKNSISFFEKIFGEAASVGVTVIEADHAKAKAQYQMLLEELISIDNEG